MLSLKSASFAVKNVRWTSSRASKMYPRMKVKASSVEAIPKYQHPWIYNIAIASKAPAGLESGAVVDLTDSRGHFLARGTYSADSRMTVRVLTYDQNEAIDGAFWRRRIHSSLERRRQIVGLDGRKTNAYRVINAENDMLPGLVVDKYGDWYTMQVQNAGIEYHREEVVDALNDVLRPKGGIYERSDEGNRQKDGLPFRKGVVSPPGAQVPQTVQIIENGRKLLVDLVRGHKTGFYLDQRENRSIVGSLCSGKRVLNCFSYSAAFAVAALQNGATHVMNVDSSADALLLGTKNLELNGFTDPASFSNHEANVFEYLRELVDQGNHQFDVIILDPPKFSASSATVNTAAKGYKDINRLAMKLLSPGGILATFSCSASIDPHLFRQIVSSASIEAERPAQIMQYLGQPADHPVGLFFPEGLYLKGLLVKAL